MKLKVLSKYTLRGDYIIMEENKEQLQSTMTEEDIEKVQAFMEENRQNSESLSQVFDIVNDKQDIKDTGEDRLVNVSVDPETGRTIITNTEEVEAPTSSIDDILDGDISFDIDESDISLEELRKYLSDTKMDPIINGLFTESDLSQDDIATLLDLVIKKQNKEKLDSPYNKLPDICKEIIDNTMGKEYADSHLSGVKSYKNDMAEMMIDQFIQAITIERASKSINSTIEHMFDKTSAEIGDAIVGYTEERNEKYRQYINEKVTDPEKREDALRILDDINNAYKLTELKEFCKKCKIRKIDVEHPDDLNNNDIDYILSKYSQNPKFNIYNIYNGQQVLLRNLNPEGSDTVYTSAQVRAFLIAFCRYCMNFNPNNTEEHIFMFYTIYNIFLTDINKGEKATVSINFLDNVKECIHNIIERNLFLK